MRIDVGEIDWSAHHDEISNRLLEVQSAADEGASTAKLGEAGAVGVMAQSRQWPDADSIMAALDVSMAAAAIDRASKVAAK